MWNVGRCGSRSGANKPNPNKRNKSTAAATDHNPAWFKHSSRLR
jgi:hypothetical protein